MCQFWFNSNHIVHGLVLVLSRRLVIGFWSVKVRGIDDAAACCRVVAGASSKLLARSPGIFTGFFAFFFFFSLEKEQFQEKIEPELIIFEKRAYKLTKDFMKFAQIVARFEENPFVIGLRLKVVLRVAHEQADIGVIGQFFYLPQKDVFADEKIVLNFEKVDLGF